MLVEINVVIVGLAGWYYQDGDLPQLVTVDKSKSPMFLSLPSNSYRVIDAAAAAQLLYFSPPAHRTLMQTPNWRGNIDM